MFSSQHSSFSPGTALHEQKALTGGGQKLSHGQFYRKGRKERKGESALSIPGLNAL